jgi:predicted NAD/FAD-binding protein
VGHPAKSDRICIVGAGPAGLSTAYFLAERGYTRVTVLEKNAQVGGKARTWYVDGTPIDLGALDVAKGYQRVRALAELVGQPLVRTAPMGVMDLRSGVATRKLSTLLATVGKLKLGWMVTKYLYFTGLRYADFLEQPGMTDVPEDLTAPMATWLERHGMGELRPVFDYACTNFGYGPVDVIPAAYLLRFMDFSDFMEVLAADLGLHSWPRNVKHGYQSLWEGVAGRLNDVRLGVTIEGITRHPMTPDPVQVRLAGGEMLRFDHVIVACCLDRSIGTLVTDLAPPERALFGAIRTQPYSTTVCRIQGMPRIALGAVPVAPFGRTYCMIKNWDKGDGAAFYIMNPDGLPLDQLLANLRADMAALRSLDGTPLEVRVGEMLHHEDWAYFPHVSSADLAAGFYDEFERMQGGSGTYFTGGLLGFETVGNTVRYSESLVERFFPA